MHFAVRFFSSRPSAITSERRWSLELLGVFFLRQQNSFWWVIYSAGVAFVRSLPDADVVQVAPAPPRQDFLPDTSWSYITRCGSQTAVSVPGKYVLVFDVIKVLRFARFIGINYFWSGQERRWIYWSSQEWCFFFWTYFNVLFWKNSIAKRPVFQALLCNLFHYPLYRIGVGWLRSLIYYLILLLF